VLVWEAVHDYLHHLAVERGLAGQSIAAYTYDLDYMLESLAIRNVETIGDVARAHLLGFLADRAAAGDSARTQQRRWSTVFGLFRWLRLEGEIKVEPTKDIDWPQWEPRLHEVLSRSEVAGILAAPGIYSPLGLRDTALFEFLYATGARVSEACTLQLDALHFDEGLVLLTGKGNKQRAVPLRGAVVAAMLLYLVEGRPELLAKSKAKPGTINNWVFLNHRGDRLRRQGCWDRLEKAAREAGITRPVSPHQIRHSFATHMMEGGADIATVQLLLGHANASTTEVYTHLDMTKIRELYDLHHPRA
jgi:integrase/recombinase XerD